MKKYHLALRPFLVIILMIAIFGPAGLPARSRAPRLHPLLAQLAADSPEQTVRVIIQESENSDRAERLVAGLGGVVTKDLGIINAFAAELPAQATPMVARLAAVSWVSLDAPVVQSGGPDGPVDTDDLLNIYNAAIGADSLWAEGYQGSSVTVAVIDSGIADDIDDFGNRIIADVEANASQVTEWDHYGHGTHVAGIIGGNGEDGNSSYIGVAPKVKLVNVKVSDDQGAATESDVVTGIEWVYDHKDQYGIRVVNVSINSTVADSYHNSAINAALEILWHNGIVVVVSAGNNGVDNPGVIFPPANDPYFIAVGSADDQGTTAIADDSLSSFSSYGTTTGTNLDGSTYSFSRPDIVAPGRDIIAAGSDNNVFAAEHPDRVVDEMYFRLSGTSAAAAVTSGAIALLLQDEPNLTPDQVKYRLMATAAPITEPEPGAAGAGLLDIYAAVHSNTTETANDGLVPHELLAKMALIAYWASENGGDTIDWNAVNWNAVNWNAVNWNAVSWNAVSWNAVNWNAVSWNAVNWNAVNWNAVNWNAVNWNAVSWNAVSWNAVSWNSAELDGIFWGHGNGD